MIIPYGVVLAYRLNEDDLTLYEVLRDRYFANQRRPIAIRSEEWKRYVNIAPEAIRDALSVLEGVGLIWSKRIRGETWYGVTDLSRVMRQFDDEAWAHHATVYSFAVACRTQAIQEREAFQP